MVLIITDPIQRKRWEDYNQHYGRVRRFADIDSDVINLSKEFSIKELKSKITISNERLMTIRGRARRQGLL